jgi:hypothetical protein
MLLTYLYMVPRIYGHYFLLLSAGMAGALSGPLV